MEWAWCSERWPCGDAAKGALPVCDKGRQVRKSCRPLNCARRLVGKLRDEARVIQ